MKSFETWKTWAFIIGLLLFSALASFAWPVIQEELDFDFEGVYATPTMEGLEVEGSELVTIQLEGYLLGEVLVEAPLIGELDGMEVHPLVLGGILAAIFIGALFLMALPLALVYVFLDRRTVALRADEEYQEKVALIEKQQKEELKVLEEKQPPVPPRPEPEGWSVVSMSAFVLLFMAIAGFALADTFYGDQEVEFYSEALVNPAGPLVGVLLILTFLGLVFYYRPRRGELVAAESEESAIPWGTIWVVVSGLIFLGIGIGLMLAVRSMGTG